MKKKTIIPLQEWIDKVQYGSMADYEGYALPIINGKPSHLGHMLVPSRRLKDIPEGVTEVEMHLGL